MQKAKNVKHLEVKDLQSIAEWGGPERGRPERIEAENNPNSVRTATKKAIEQVHSPEKSLRELLGLKQWGLTYASKTLRFIEPLEHGALDSWIRLSLTPILWDIKDGKNNSMIRGYSKFLAVCKEIQHTANKETNPRGIGPWWIADIGDALFEFARANNSLTEKSAYQ